jgi:hypothetical protein
MEDGSFARANPEGARAVLTAWAGKFPQDALKWASAKAPENVFALPGEDLKALARGLSDADPALFTDFLKTAPPGSEFVAGGLSAYVSAGKIGIKSAYADLYANSKDGRTYDVRTSVASVIATLAGGISLESIANLADQAIKLPQIPGDPPSQSAPVINAYARTDPGAALAWATKLPSGNTRNNALSAGVTRLAMVDPDAALQYVRDFPGGSTVERMNLLSGIKNGAKQNPTLPPEEKAQLMDQADVLLSQLKSKLKSQQQRLPGP